MVLLKFNIIFTFIVLVILSCSKEKKEYTKPETEIILADPLEEITFDELTPMGGGESILVCPQYDRNNI